MILFRVLDGAHDLATTIIGTPYYMSPELLSNKPYDQKVSLDDLKERNCSMYILLRFILSL